MSCLSVQGITSYPSSLSVRPTTHPSDPYPLPGLCGCGDHDRVADGQGKEEVSDGGGGGGKRLGSFGVGRGLQPQGSILYFGQ